MPRIFSPTVAASIGLAILAFAAPGRARAQPAPIAHVDERTSQPPIEDETTHDVSDPAPAIAASYERSRWQKPRTWAAAGVRFGNFTINGDSSGTAIPFHVDVGLRRDRVLVFASYDVLGISAHVPAPDDPARMTSITDLGNGSGLAHRVGASARYVVQRMGESDGGFEFWAEGGLGVQHLRWDAGGTLTRPDLSVGLGTTMVFLGRKKHGGFSLGLRIMVSPRNDSSNSPPTCGGPCDTPSTPTSFDRSFLFDLSVPFGT